MTLIISDQLDPQARATAIASSAAAQQAAAATKELAMRAAAIDPSRISMADSAAKPVRDGLKALRGRKLEQSIEIRARCASSSTFPR